MSEALGKPEIFTIPRRLPAAICAFLLFLSFAAGVRAQVAGAPDGADADARREQIKLAAMLRDGTSEEKRTALFAIRNRRAAEYSRLAAAALRDADEAVRATAAFAVVFLPPAEAFAALAPNLADKSPMVRRETAYALGAAGDPAAVAPLVALYGKDKEIEVKNAALVALGPLGEPAAVDFLTAILKRRPKNDNDFERRSAARALGQIAQIAQVRSAYAVTPENFLPEKYKLFALAEYEDLGARLPAFRAAVPVLTGVLENARESDDARREAAFALGAIGDPAALGALRRYASAPDYYLAEICKEAARKLAPAETVTSQGSR